MKTLIKQFGRDKSTVIDGLLKIELGCDNDYTIDIENHDIIELLSEYNGDYVKLTIEKI